MPIGEILITIILKKATEVLVDGAIQVVKPALEHAITDWVQRSIKGANSQLALSFSANGRQSAVPVQQGVLQAAPFIASPTQYTRPIHLSGAFFADPSFADYAEIILENDEKTVILLVVDEDTGDMVVGSFGFGGYAISLPPGLYSFTACIVDPVLDEFLAIGYPRLMDDEDPNPVKLTGSGSLRLDFILFEIDDDPYQDWDDDILDEDLWDDEDEF